ncbi:MAG: YceI family protein [Myxococcota bacterium]
MTLGLLLVGLTHAGSFKITGKPKVTFHAEGSPGFLTFEGITRSLTVQDDGDRLTFTVPMDTVKTGIELRDQHMREKYVQTAEFPNVELTLDRAAVDWPSAGARTQGELTAQFVAHGVSRDVAVTYELREKKGQLEARAEFAFDTSEHGIDIPSYLGVTIKPAMRAEVVVILQP